MSKARTTIIKQIVRWIISSHPCPGWQDKDDRWSSYSLRETWLVKKVEVEVDVKVEVDCSECINRGEHEDAKAGAENVFLASVSLLKQDMDVAGHHVPFG
jgi:hypothetical protein